MGTMETFQPLAREPKAKVLEGPEAVGRPAVGGRRRRPKKDLPAGWLLSLPLHPVTCMKPLLRLALLASITGRLLAEGPDADPAARLEFFEQRIRPALVEHCHECHSATAKKIQGGLRVDSRAALLAGGDTGPAVVPGKPESSWLIRALDHSDRDLAMPPKQAQLPAAVRQDFRRWVAAGAPWPGGDTAEAPAKDTFNLEERRNAQAWLWEPPQRQEIPAIRRTQWAADPIDHFILKPLEERWLRPADPVPDSVWLRRASFAVTGLPPTPQDQQRLDREASPQARENAVDRLLASPHFGERWARHWMDLMRYAESRGHESDFAIANAWQYRDYLVRAFNQDVPYDRFLMEHLAGDLLQPPRLRPGTDHNESVLGTGWAFLGEEVHSPVDIRQDECDRIDNKIDVFTKSFLGLTVACARCHDHKFDPIRSQDYYALSGFILSSNYRQVRFEAMENNRCMAHELQELRGRHLPALARRAGTVLRPTAQRLGSTLNQALEGESTTPEISAWVAELQRAKTNRQHLLHPLVQPEARIGTPSVTDAEVLPARRIIADFTRPDAQPWKADGEAFGPGPLPAGTLVAGLTEGRPIARVVDLGAARRDAFWNRLSNTPGNENDSGRIGSAARAGRMLRTPTVTLQSGRLHYLLRGRVKVFASVDSHLMVEGPLHGALNQTFDTGDSLEPQWVSQGLEAYSGHRAHLEFGPDGDRELEILQVVESETVPTWQPVALMAGARRDTLAKDLVDALQKRALEACDWLEGRSTNTPPTAVLRWADWWLQHPELSGLATDAEYRKLSRQLVREQEALAGKVAWQSRTAVAWMDGTGVDEQVLVRGKPFKPGILAPRSLPAAFTGAKPIQPTGGSGRLELARQLADPGNPLVARVWVNRVWHHLFGRGLVPTVDNFGALGERPTHPELLDHLAWQFVHVDRWSTKRLIRRLLLTQTYAMGSRDSDTRAPELDPANRWWHRMPVRRLEAEAIHDALLVVSGRFNPAMAGTPVPVHLTEFVIGRGRPDQSGPLDGDGRRSLYTALRRNFLPTTLQAFDFPTPFSTVGRRNVTNVPAQSLAAMNDPFFHQQAEVWARRLLAEWPEADVPTRIQALFAQAYNRPPTPTELASCQATLSELKAFHAAKPASPSDPGPWTDLCHALLNANEFLYLP